MGFAPQVGKLDVCTLAMVLAVAGFVSRLDAHAQGVAAVPSSRSAVISKYCIGCHNEKLRTASLALDGENADDPSTNPAVWEKVVRKLKAGQMPPAGMPRPEKAVNAGLADSLVESLDALAARNPNPGRPSAVHRLNRAEYANSIRDLLAVEIDSAKLLPTDNAEFGFDNNGDVLSVSPVLMERYMIAAGRISRAAVGDATMPPAAETYTVSRSLIQESRVSETLPFGSRGGIVVKHRFPVDGEYSIRVTLQRDEQGYIKGLRESQFMDVRVDGARVKLLTVGGQIHGRSGPAFSKTVVEFRGDPEQVKYEMTADEELEVRFSAKAGEKLVGVTFLEQQVMPEGEMTPGLLLADRARFRRGQAAIEAITLLGPHKSAGVGETASRRRIFSCHPTRKEDEEPCARKILSSLARRAYRRPVNEQDLQPLLHQFNGRDQRIGYEDGIRRALKMILAGPDFLFRFEKEPASIGPNQPYAISDVELASRLSFFLWSSMPDDELLAVAERGELKQAPALEKQVRRMLGDPRAQSMMDNFGSQWLNLRELDRVSPDPDAFPDFDDNLRQAFQTETRLYLETMFREDQSVLNLLKSDFTYVNDRLAKHYGMPEVHGSHFRRVSLDANRQGLLGQGSVLTVTSYARRTSPVLRGKWVLEQLLGMPPPAPPPDVPALDEKSKDGKPTTMRQAMEQHRANPVCASCHKVMDPIGFALENYDAVGKWRTTLAGSDTALDVSGVLPDGTAFRGASELQRALLANPEQFVHNVTEKLLTYALGRGVEYYDAPVIRKIVKDADSRDYRWSELVLGIVKSTPFQMRRSGRS